MRIDEITDFELSILQYLWEHGEATTREITTAVYAGMPITKAKMASVQKLIERLEAKGCVERYDCGKKEHRLRPIATRDHFLRGRLQALADRVCEGARSPGPYARSVEGAFPKGTGRTSQGDCKPLTVRELSNVSEKPMNAFWEIVVSNAILVVVLAAAVAMVGRFWKNPHGLYVLWLLVLLKFVTPPLFTVGFHLPGKPMSVVHDDPITVSAGEEARTAELDRSPLPASSEQTVAPDPSVDVPQVAGQREIPWLIVLAGLWTIGFGGIAVWLAFRILRFGRLLRAAQPAPPDVLRMAAETGKQLGLRRAPAIRMLPVRVSPMIWIIGLKPQVLLPMELFKQLGTCRTKLASRSRTGPCAAEGPPGSTAPIANQHALLVASGRLVGVSGTATVGRIVL